MRSFAVGILVALLPAAPGCCSDPEAIRISFTAPGDASDDVQWRERIVLPPGFDIVVEYADGHDLTGEPIEVYRDADGARVDVAATTTRGVEHDGECAAHTHSVYALRELDNGNHTAVHRRASGAGRDVAQDDMPAWSDYEGEEALLFTFCVWDNSGMLNPCGGSSARLPR